MKKNKMKRGLLTLLAGASLLVAGCSGGAGANVNYDEAESIKLGSVFAQSGEVSAYGLPQAQAIQMAVEEINADGGINGKNIELVEYDYGSNDSEAATITTRLLTQDQVSTVIGPDVSGASVAALQVANQNQVPLLSPSASLDSFTLDQNGEAIPFGWRICYPDSYQGNALAEFAANDLGASKAAILGDNSSDYATGLVSTFSEAFPGEIVTTENFTARETDFSAVLTNIKNTDFDVLFIPGYYEEAGPIIKQAREMGITQPILGPDGFGNEALYELAGSSNLNDVYYTTQFSALSGGEKVDEFMKNFSDKFGKQADMFAAMAYDGAYVVKDAIERAGSADPAAINEALAETKDFEGVTGTFSFDDLHNPIKTVTIIEVQNGEDVEAHTVEAE